MDLDKIAGMLGLDEVDPEAAAEAGALAAEKLHAALETATTRMEKAEVLARVLGDEDTILTLAAYARYDAGAWHGELAKLRAVKGLAIEVRQLAKFVAAATKGIRVARGPREVDPCQPTGWISPVGYEADSSGVYRVTDPESGAVEQILTAPLYISGRLVDVESGAVAWRLRWPGPYGKPVEQVVEAQEVYDARTLIGLSRFGVPVGSHNAREVVAYLDLAAAANAGRLPVERTAQRCGWLPGGFLLGEQWIGEEPAVSLRADEGGEQLAQGIRTGGTWEGWCEAVQRGASSPAAWLAIYGAVASVLVDFLGLTEGYVLDWSGETSRGKTTVLRVAASVWGEPTPHGLMQSWSLTSARAEGVAGMLQHLPLILDDTKQARRPDVVSALLYSHVFGQARGRAKPGRAGQSVGLRVSATWRSVLLSTGEARATSFSQDAGARARTLCFVGAPLEDARQAQAITLGVLAHYGHLGPRVVRSLQQDGAPEWVSLRDHYREQFAPHGAVAGRLADAVALLDLAQRVAERAGCPVAEGEPIQAAIQAAMLADHDADIPATALGDVLSTAMARTTSLWGRHTVTSQGEPVVPAGGWLGGMDKGDTWSHVDLRMTWVKEQLQTRGHDVDGVVTRWAERGWLDGSGGRESRTSRLDGVPQRVYRFRRSALEAIGLVEA
jgi:putative DNA primase/helicase